MSTCTGTEVTKDYRGSGDKRPVWEKTITYACVTADTVATIAMPIDGLLQKVVYKRPDTANDNLTSTLTIADSGDNVIFTTGAGLAEDDTSHYTLSEPLTGTCDVAITFSEAVGSSATFNVYLRGV